MLMNANEEKTTKFNNESHQAMGISTNVSKLFQGITNNIYKEKAKTVVRELVSNAIDATKLTDTKENIILNLPVSAGDTFYVQDFGIGMTPELFIEVFCNYFASTKEEKENQIGGFGIGGKTPFIYSNTFTVETTSPDDGVRRTFKLYNNKGSSPSYTYIEDMDVENSKIKGTKVSFVLKSDSDVVQFINTLDQIVFFRQPNTNELIDVRCNNEPLDVLMSNNYIDLDYAKDIHNALSNNGYVVKLINTRNEKYCKDVFKRACINSAFNEDKTDIKINFISVGILYNYTFVAYDEMEEKFIIEFHERNKCSLYLDNISNFLDGIENKHLTHHYAVFINSPISGNLELTLSRENIAENEENNIKIKKMISNSSNNYLKDKTNIVLDKIKSKNNSHTKFANLILLTRIKKYLKDISTFMKIMKMSKSDMEVFSEFISNVEKEIKKCSDFINSKIEHISNSRTKSANNFSNTDDNNDKLMLINSKQYATLYESNFSSVKNVYKLYKDYSYLDSSDLKLYENKDNIFLNNFIRGYSLLENKKLMESESLNPLDIDYRLLPNHYFINVENIDELKKSVEKNIYNTYKENNRKLNLMYYMKNSDMSIFDSAYGLNFNTLSLAKILLEKKEKVKTSTIKSSNKKSFCFSFDFSNHFDEDLRGKGLDEVIKHIDNNKLNYKLYVKSIMNKDNRKEYLDNSLFYALLIKKRAYNYSSYSFELPFDIKRIVDLSNICVIDDVIYDQLIENKKLQPTLILQFKENVQFKLIQLKEKNILLNKKSINSLKLKVMKSIGELFEYSKTYTLRYFFNSLNEKSKEKILLNIFNEIGNEEYNIESILLKNAENINIFTNKLSSYNFISNELLDKYNSVCGIKNEEISNSYELCNMFTHISNLILIEKGNCCYSNQNDYLNNTRLNFDDRLIEKCIKKIDLDNVIQDEYNEINATVNKILNTKTKTLGIHSDGILNYLYSILIK